MGIRLRLAAAIVSVVMATWLPTDARADAPSCLRATVDDGGDALTLSAAVEGTTALRLAGVVVPPSPVNGPSATPWLPQVAARTGLAGLIVDHCLSLVPDVPPVDRYNRVYAHVLRDDGLWIQGELVRRGLVVVMPGLDAAEQIRRLLPLEIEARTARRGLWADDHYGVRSVDDVGQYVGTLQLVEGTVRKATRVGPQIYLNFGDDWRSDFTIVIPAKALAVWARSGVDPLLLGGRRIRVRGVIETLNGPMIEAPQPEAIEILDNTP